MKTTSPASHADQVIPVTLTAPNRHTHAMIRVADACPDQDRPITTRITPNTGSAKTSRAHASWLLAGGADIQRVKEKTGHLPILTTQKYLHTLPDNENDPALDAFTKIRNRKKDRTGAQGAAHGA
jgi:hypothetical protein